MKISHDSKLAFFLTFEVFLLIFAVALMIAYEGTK